MKALSMQDSNLHMQDAQLLLTDHCPCCSAPYFLPKKAFVQEPCPCWPQLPGAASRGCACAGPPPQKVPVEKGNKHGLKTAAGADGHFDFKEGCAKKAAQILTLHYDRPVLHISPAVHQPLQNPCPKENEAFCRRTVIADNAARKWTVWGQSGRHQAPLAPMSASHRRLYEAPQGRHDVMRALTSVAKMAQVCKTCAFACCCCTIKMDCECVLLLKWLTLAAATAAASWLSYVYMVVAASVAMSITPALAVCHLEVKSPTHKLASHSHIEEGRFRSAGVCATLGRRSCHAACMQCCSFHVSCVKS